MNSERTHYVTTSDGVTIGATVHGQGPPLVFLQGVIGDGDLDFQELLPHLTDRFTCHLPSMRGRGLSGDHPDLSVGRVIKDYVTYVHSLGEPTRVVGWSAGANHALAVAAQTDMVTSIAPYEPVANTVMDEQELAALRGAVARAAELAGDGELAAAMRAFADYPFSEQDIAAADDAGYFEAAGRYVPSLLNVFQQLMEYEGPLPDDPAVLGQISVPTLMLHGTETRPFFATSVRHVADHIASARTKAIAGAGHAAPLTHPETLATALTDFFAPAQQSA